MDIEQKMELCLKLLEITAESRFAIMKDIWNLQVRTRPLGHNQYRDTISDAITKLRQEIFDALISDAACREGTDFRYEEPQYPSKGCYAIFPNMVFSQMLAYLWKDVGLYIGAHDRQRGVKEVNFYRVENGVT